MDLERNFKIKVRDDLSALNGEEFERFSRFILELVLNEKVTHKGQNLCAKPVKSTADFADTQYEIIGQSGTDEGYFDDFKKPLNDITGALKNHSTSKTIYLFSNRYAGTSRLGDLIKDAKDNKVTQTIIPYDSEKIAETILDKILASHIVDDIFKYLPSAFELYKILPKTSQIPSHKGNYYERIEENVIINKLNSESLIQIYGLSGIGKTEITIGVAQKLLKRFDTVLWIEGDSVQNSKIDFNAIKISKFDKLINLSTILESYSVCVVFDNINHNASDISEAFLKHNKKNSVCIISSLTKSLDDTHSLKLNEVSVEIASKILFDGNPELEDTKRQIILTYTGKHPLILRILSSSIKNNLFNWDSLISELEEINRLNDKDKNQTIANRIIGKIKQTNEKELAALNFVSNRFITQPFLEKLIGKVGVGKLLDNTILGKDDTKNYSTHQIVLDSIKAEVTNLQWIDEFTQKVKIYLMEHNEIKDISFYNVMFNHRILLDKILDSTADIELKQVILYSVVQCTDITMSAQIDLLIAKINPLILENKTYYENLLSIEIAEINLFKIDKKKEKEKYKEETEKAIETLAEFIKTAKDDTHKATILHHIGKFYFKIGEDSSASQKFEEVLTLKPNDPFALLQIARIASKARKIDKVKEITETIFGLSACPISVLLSFYELITFNNYNDLKSTFIDQKIDSFVVNIVDALDSRYDQPYSILGKISGHLSYNFPEYFETIVDNLPTPANVDFNDNLRFSFALTLVSFYKYLKYNGSKETNKMKMDKVLALAKVNFELSKLDSDYKKSQFVDLLIEAEEFDLAEQQADNFDDVNEFNLQKLSKIYRGQGKFTEAIEAANEAIDFNKEQQSAYLSAFLNDRAEAENGGGMKLCLDTLNEAIEKQTNDKTKKQWTNKLNDWIIKYNGS
jgi:tetratricopeptide (TPR) repeat protein